MYNMSAVRITPVPIMGQRPLLYRMFEDAPKRGMGQLVSVNPNLQVQVNTGIEQYLFPVGLMAAGGASFLAGTALPPEAKSWTTLIGLALLGSGVGVLIYRGLNPASKGGSAPAPAPSGAIPASGGGAVAAPPPAFAAPPPDAFAALQISVLSPVSGQSVQAVGGFLGLGTKSIPMQVQLYNPSPVDVTFTLNFTWDEMPSLAGYNRGSFHGSKAFQVTLKAGQVQNQEFDLPIQADVTWSLMNVDTQIYSQRTPAENPQLLSNLTFSLT